MAAIAPHCHPDMLQIILAVSGSCSFAIDEDVHALQAPCLVAIPGGGMHGFEIGQGVRGWAVTIAHRQVIDLVVNHNIEIGQLLRRTHIARFAQNRADLRAIALAMRGLAEEMGCGEEGAAVCIEALQRLVLIHASRAFRKGHEASGRSSGSDRELFLEFRAMVERLFLTERRIARYIAMLKCSHARLNRACATHAGMTAKGVILERLIDEAKRRLTFSSASASRIGDALGFPEPSYFVRLFRQRTGLTPGQFRNESQSRSLP